MKREAGWQDLRNVFCVRLDTIGDVLMTTPAIRALRESAPGRRVTLLTSSRAAELAPLIPELDHTIVYDPPWMKATDESDAKTDLLLIDLLRGGRFDAAVIFTVYSQSPLPAALLCHLAGIPRVLAHCRENPYRLLSDWVRESEPEEQLRHEARRQLDLVATAGCFTSNERYSLSLPVESTERVSALLSGYRLSENGPWCVVHPGASAESRRYPAESFAEAVRMLIEDHGWRVVLTGDTSERALARTIANVSPEAVSLAGRLSLAELSALIQAAPLLISNNTAPVHIAGAVGTPVVDIYALTNPQHTPWQVPNRVLSYDVPCRNCYRSVCPEGHHLCLRGITPQEVVEAALELLRESRPSGFAAVPTKEGVVP